MTRTFCAAWLLVVLAACAQTSVRTWDEVPVTDPDELASPGEIEAVEAALDDLRAWTGRAAILVSEIRFVESVDEGDTHGSYSPLDGLILVEAGRAPVDTRHTTRHELCHALDWTESHAIDNPTIFDPAREDDGVLDHYSEDEGEAVRERFARDCDDGPGEAWRYAIQSECGGLYPHEAYLWEAVWLGVEPVERFSVVEGEKRWVTDLPPSRLRAWAAAPGGIFILLRDDATFEESLIFVDAWTAAIGWTHPLWPGPFDRNPDATLLATGHGVLLVAVDDRGHAQAWEVDPSGAFTSLPYAPRAPFRTGVVAGDTAYLEGNAENDTDDIRIVDLTTGIERAVDAGGFLGNRAWSHGGDAWWVADHAVLRFEGDSWEPAETRELPPFPGSGVPLGDQWLWPLWEDAPVQPLALQDLQGGALRLQEPACACPGGALILMDGEPWLTDLMSQSERFFLTPLELVDAP